MSNLQQGRKRELSELRDLLFEIQTINRGSGCLQRIEWCIQIAEKLTKPTIDTGEPSFLTFVADTLHGASP